MNAWITNENNILRFKPKIGSILAGARFFKWAKTKAEHLIFAYPNNSK